MMLRKIFLAVVVLFTTSNAFAKVSKAAPPDMGTVQMKACDGGFVVAPLDAKGFNLVFGAMILSTSQLGPISNLIPEEEQKRAVAVLQRLDTISDAKSEQCLKVTGAESALLLSHMLKMTGALQAAHAEDSFDQVLLLLTKGDKPAAFKLVEEFNVVMRSLVFVSAH